MKSLKSNHGRDKAGFSLVELTIVVVILGVLAMMAVPRYQTAVERSKASESFAWLAQVESAQERYNSRNGQFAKKMKDLDLDLQNPEFFSTGNFTSYNWQTRWELKLTRKGASSGYGRYTVTWNQDGFARSRSSIKDELIPVN